MKTLQFLIVLLCTTTLVAQSWQWGKRGGGQGTIGAGPYDEETRRIAVDAQGNIFITSVVSKTSLNVDGIPQTAYGLTGGTPNIVVASFSCDGAYRWSKINGGGGDGYIHDLKTDSQGNVYITGRIGTPGQGLPNHFDTDLVLPLCSNPPPVNCQSFYIAKYSNSGSLLWVKFLEPANVSPSDDTFFGWGWGFEMSIDPSDHVHLLCELRPGVFAEGGYTNTTSGRSVHVLKFNSAGTFLSGHPLQMNYQNNFGTGNLRMVRNPTTGTYYISGWYFQATPPVVAGVPLTGAMFLLAFNSQGNLLWKIESTLPDHGNLNHLAIDSEGMLYITGATSGTGGLNDYPSDSFAGQMFEVGQNFGIEFPFVMKLDGNGQFIWKSNATTGGDRPGGIVLNGNEVAIGLPVGTTEWAGEEILAPANTQGTNAAIVRLNKTTGALLEMTQIESGNGGGAERVGSIAADHLGNYYLGGKFETQMFVGASTLVSNGGNTDFFVAKLGTSNCNCQVPTCSYKALHNAAVPNTVDFKYEGQEVYTSVSWNFGDNSALSSQVNPTHTYAAPGIYNVCVTATNACDTFVFCKTLNTAVLSNPTFATPTANTLLLYPNPAKNQVNIQYDTPSPKAQLEVYDLTGRLVASYTTTQSQGTWSLDLHPMASGVYVVVLKDASGIILQKKLQVL